MAGRAPAGGLLTTVLVPPARWRRWLENFTARHGETSLSAVDGAMRGEAADGSHFTASPPFAREYAGGELLDLCAPPASWGVLLVRKGGFAVAALRGDAVSGSKVGQRHVQGRTKAGGQSSTRFANRRDNQARVAYEAAAEHAARILAGVRLVVTGGDHDAVEAVLADRRLARVRVVPPWLAVPDPRRSVLEQAIADAGSLRVEVVNS